MVHAFVMAWVALTLPFYCVPEGSSAAVGPPEVVGNDARFVPDESMQTALGAMAPLSVTDPVEFYRRALQMKESVWGPGVARGRDPKLGLEQYYGLIRQLAYFASRQNDGMQAQRRTCFSKFVALTDIERSRVIEALAPFFESTDEDLSSFVTERVIGGDVQSLVTYGVRNTGKLTSSMIEHMYTASPNPQNVVLGLANAFGLESGEASQIALAARIVDDVEFWESHNVRDRQRTDDARKRLNELLTSKRWWVRRYVSEVVWRNDRFRTKQIVDAIRKDSDPLVAAALERPEGQQQLERRR